ncbi:MAG: hypothetical protein HYV07_32080 [Deltaproteobacteria bacterium]|nr:hypothetical protein [Deltaproteobacteria bacterium]
MFSIAAIAAGLWFARERVVDPPTPVVAGAETAEIDRQVREITYERARKGRGRYLVAILNALSEGELESIDDHGASSLVTFTGANVEVATSFMMRLKGPEPFSEVKLVSAQGTTFRVTVKPSTAPISIPAAATLPERLDQAALVDVLSALARERGVTLDFKVLPSGRDRWLVKQPVQLTAKGGAQKLADFLAAIDASPTLTYVSRATLRNKASGAVASVEVVSYARP